MARHKGLKIGDEALINFDDLRNEIEERADRNFPDEVIDLRTLEFLASGRVYAPGRGILMLTDWSKSQLSSMFGVRWDTWFKDCTGKEIQEEMQRRFNRRDNQMMLRSRKHPPEAEKEQEAGADDKKEEVASDGILRAVLSPNYHPLDDRWLLDRMALAVRGRIQEGGFLRSRSTEDAKSSHYTYVPGNSEINMGTGGQDDILYAGWKIRNSEVGGCALSFDDFWFRLWCSNGMMDPDPSKGSGRLLYRTHRHIADEEFDGMLVNMFEIARSRQQDTLKKFKAAQAVSYASDGDAKDAITIFLERAKYSRDLVDRARKAYDAEPIATGFGAMNAITRAARDLQDKNQRHDMEHAAGKFVTQIVKKAA